MSWLNPWAWFGLAALAVPIAIHFLTRAQPRPQPFPTLRFLTVATTSAMRRRILRDRALLAVRLAILAAIVAALAQPYLKTRGRLATGASAITRAVIIDTSASMSRPTADGRRAIDVAREKATSLEPAAATTTIDAIGADEVRDAIAAATTWLTRRGGRGELAIVSDFQQGSLSAGDLAAVPATIGVKLVKIDVPASPTVTGPSTRIRDRVWTPRVTIETGRTSVTWTAAAQPGGAPMIRMVGGPADAARIATAVAAADAIGAPDDAPTHAIVIELPSAPEPTAAVAKASAIDALWMFDALERISADESVIAAAHLSTADPAVEGATTAAVVARDAMGTPVVRAAGRGTGQSAELVLFARTGDPLLLASLVRAVGATRRDPAAIRELDPTSIAPDVLATWQRPVPAVGSPAPDDPDASDGRWFWIAALILLAIETWLRRSRPTTAVTEVAHARVA